MKIDNGPNIGKYFIKATFEGEIERRENGEWVEEFANKKLLDILEELVKENFKSSYPKLETKLSSMSLDKMYIVVAGYITTVGTTNKDAVNFYFHIDNSGKIKTLTMDNPKW